MRFVLSKQSFESPVFLGGSTSGKILYRPGLGQFQYLEKKTLIVLMIAVYNIQPCIKFQLSGYLWVAVVALMKAEARSTPEIDTGCMTPG